MSRSSMITIILIVAMVVVGIMFAVFTAHNADVRNNEIDSQVLDGQLAAYGRCHITAVAMDATFPDHTMVVLFCR